MRFILGNNEVIQPSGMADLTMEKIRDKKLFGFIRKEMAYVKDIGEVGFYQQQAIDILQNAYDSKGIDAELDFAVEDDEGNTLFSSEIDFSNFREDGRNFFANFRDKNGVIEFDSQRTVNVALNQTSSIFIPSQRIFTGISHQFEDASRIVELSKNGVFLDASHTFPLKVKVKDSIGKGTGLSITDPYKQEPIWLNTAGETKIVRVGAKLDCNIRIDSFANVVATPVLRVFDQGNTKIIERTLAPLPIVTNTVMSKSFNIDETVSVPILGYIQLVLNVSYSSTSGSYYKFEYLTSSFLSIEEDVQIQGSDCRCIPVYDAFSQIVNTISQGKLELSSSHLQKSGWILTSGLNLRGESAVINTSFDQLFEDIQKLECLKAAIDGNKLIIEPYGKMLSSIGMQISNESLINKMPFTDLLYNEIKAGCSNWKSDTPSGNEEVNAIATYTTGIKKIKQSCDLVLKNISTSSRLIEVTRRMQYNQETSNAKTDTKNDNTLFLIDSDSKSAIVGPYGLNELASPYEILKKWSYVLANNLSLSFSTQEGNTNIVPGSDLIQLKEGAFTNRMVIIEAPEHASTYINTEDVISFVEGDSLQRVLVTEMSYRWGGDNKLIIHGYILNDNFKFIDSDYNYSRKVRGIL